MTEAEFLWGSRHDKTERDRNRPRVDALHSVTPTAFRDALIAMARSVCSDREHVA